MKIDPRYFIVIIFLVVCARCTERPSEKIDRFALVNRHHVVLTAVDTLGSLSVGNGEFAFTVDVSGLQTFPSEYENGIPLGTQTQWAWHSIPSGKKYSLNDVYVPYESCDGTQAPYPIQHKDGVAGEATQQLRANPHRLHLGLIGLEMTKSNGERVQLKDLTNIHQELNLWTGLIESSYEVEGIPVHVKLYSHQQQDGIGAQVQSPLIQLGRLKVKFDFPYAKDCHTCAGYDFDNPDRHTSELIQQESHEAVIKRVLDSTTYFTKVSWTGNAALAATSNLHQFKLQGDKRSDLLEFTVLFSPSTKVPSIDFQSIQTNSTEAWKNFWSTGGAVDFSECTDPRAKELERRVVLSQYLTKIQCAGSLPPQETGLTMNSWFGKFHLEMHLWHAAQFALWGRPDLVEKSMNWYQQILPKAQSTAKLQGYTGARWPKMTDPYGNESPSSVGAFIIWQQPHPIYMAELLYRAHPDKNTLEKYQDIVFQTADFMASFAKLRDGQYHLCHPLIPAQEIFSPANTDDPAYELQYWHYALSTAQIWRKRLGLGEETKWNEVLRQLTPLPTRENLYLPVATAPVAYSDSSFRRDHPSITAAIGFLPVNNRLDTTLMTRTLANIMNEWQWPTTWGWDYPMLAMTATRLHKPEIAIDALMMDVQKNTYLVNGHNYQDKRLRLYLPGNGGLLAAVALMTAGWDENRVANPGFPKDGKWKVKWEGLKEFP